MHAYVYLCICTYPYVPMQVRMVITVHTVQQSLIPRMPQLALVQKLGAGVEKLVQEGQLPPEVHIHRYTWTCIGAHRHA